MKKKFFVMAGILAVVMLAPTQAWCQDWPMFHHNLQLTGYTTSEAPDAADLKWTYDTGTPISSSPAVVGGIVYIGSGDWQMGGPGGLYAINAETGALIWSYPTTQAVVSSPAVEGGEVFFGCYDGNVYALDAQTGALEWSFPTGGQVWSCPAVHNGKVFISSFDGNTYCIDVVTGTQTWSAPLGTNSAVSVVNGKVFVGTHSGNPTLVALDETDGSVIWRYDRADGGFINDNGACVQNGKVYFGIVVFGDIGGILCLPEDDPNSDGAIDETEVIWTYLCRNYTAPEGMGPGWVTSTPAIHNDKIFVGSDDGYLYCLDAATGAWVWEYNIGSATWSAPAVADGKVFFGAKDHTLYALNEATGGLVWSYFTGTSRIDVSPAVADGKVFIGSENGKVYVFGPISVEIYVDIKPQSCPNPFNTKAKGVLPVAILGIEDFDVTTVDPATVLLEGVAPLRWNFEDVSTPLEPGADTCECTTEGPDGYMDMTLKFDHREILAALDLVTDGEVKVLTLTGMTYDSIPIMGQDCVVIIHKGAAKLSAETPTEFSLSTNYPNPFNPETNISFTLPERTQVTLIIYNILGGRVKTLVNRDMEAGIHTIHWDGADGSGNSIASGIYFYKLSAGDFTATKKMVLTK